MKKSVESSSNDLTRTYFSLNATSNNAFEHIYDDFSNCSLPKFFLNNCSAFIANFNPYIQKWGKFGLHPWQQNVLMVLRYMNISYILPSELSNFTNIKICAVIDSTHFRPINETRMLLDKYDGPYYYGPWSFELVQKNVTWPLWKYHNRFRITTEFAMSTPYKEYSNGMRLVFLQPAVDISYWYKQDKSGLPVLYLKTLTDKDHYDLPIINNMLMKHQITAYTLLTTNPSIGHSHKVYHQALQHAPWMLIYTPADNFANFIAEARSMNVSIFLITDSIYTPLTFRDTESGIHVSLHQQTGLTWNNISDYFSIFLKNVNNNVYNPRKLIVSTWSTCHAANQMLTFLKMDNVVTIHN